MYDSEGNLQLLPSDHASRVTRLYYGEPVTNLIFGESFPDALQEEAKLPAGLVDHAPAYPSRPQYRLDRWGTEHGLPAGKVRSVIRTRDGYLWAGTVEGLARFDGARFVVFSESNSVDLQLEGSIGRALFEDETGRLWIGTERGMLCRERNGFVSFPGQEEVRGRIVNWLGSRRDGGFWIATESGLGYWDGTRVRWFDVGGVTAAGQTIRTVVDSTPGLLWIGCDTGLYEIDVASGGTNRFYEAFWDKQSGSPRISALFLDRHQRLWMSGIIGLWRWDPDATIPVPVKLLDDGSDSRPKFSRFTEDATGTVWVTGGSERGMFRFVGESLQPVSTPNAAESLDDTMCVASDQEDVIWVGTRDGLFRLRRQPVTSLALIANRGVHVLRTLAESPDGSLWFGDESFHAQWRGRDITRLFMTALGDYRMSTPVLCASSNGVWAGGRVPGIFQLSSVSSNSSSFTPVAPRFASIGIVRTMLKSRESGLWMASAQGLFRTRDFQSLEPIEPLPPMEIRALAEDSHSNLWIGTASNGLHELSYTGPKEVRIQQSSKQAGILSLHVSEDDVLWIGTSSGLSHSRAGILSVFPADTGLPQLPVYSVIEDDRNQLWLNHREGVSRVARADLEDWLKDAQRLPAVAHLGSGDGLLSIDSERSRPSALKSRDGRLWFLKQSELSVVDPAEMPPLAPAPQVWIESVMVDGKAYSTQESLKLPPGSGHTVDIRFTTTTLHSPEKVLLSYRLAGHDEKWREVGSMRRATYTNLKPGRYEFHARARNHEGRWSERDALLAIEVTPAFWQTPLFYGTSGAGIVGLVIALVVWRLRRQRVLLKVEQLKHLELERRRIARDMHDHLGAHLAGVALTSGEREVAQDQARQTLRELNELIWSVHPENDNLPSLADFIANFSERFLSAAGIGLDLDLPTEIPAIPLTGQFRHELAAMLKEALRNVVQHAQARSVTIQMTTQGNQLHLTIRDDGKGFSPANPRGNGLRNLESRAETLGGKCQTVSQPGAGTTVEISVPLPG